MNKNLEISLVKELCPVCCKEMNGPIIMNTILTEKHAKNVKDLHNKVIGFADHCCDDCAKYKNDAVFFIAVDVEKSNFHNMKDIYRTGKYCAIKKDAEFLKQESVQKNFITLKDNTKFCFIDDKDYTNFGFDKIK